MKTILSLALSTVLTFITLGQTKIPTQELIGKGNPKLTKNKFYSLRPEVAQQFELMKNAALKDGILLKVVSSTRNFDHQNRIWNRKYVRFRESGLTHNQTINKIIEYSTIPGTSRHHWGTDVDLIDGNIKTVGDVLDPSKFATDGPFCDLRAWLEENANTFGFYIVYTANKSRKGFNYEPWHYSYKPLSKAYLNAFQKLDITKILKENKLKGSQYFTSKFIEKYIKYNVNDINPILKN